MACIHFNTKTGKRGRCTAQPGKCPVCDEQHHFATEEEVNKYEDCLVNPIEDEDALLMASNAELTGTIDSMRSNTKSLKNILKMRLSTKKRPLNLKQKPLKIFKN